MISKIISGGQTGADRAALDFAIRAGIPHGGWIPLGRKTESGPLPERYRLTELETGSYASRTEKNVLESDGTLIFSHGPLTGGSALTLQLAETHGHPHIHMDMKARTLADAAETIRLWVAEKGIEVLNIAGPRAGEDPSIYDATTAVLDLTAEIPMVFPKLEGMSS